MSPKALGGIGLIFAGLALAHGMKTTSSLWPGVALFCLSGLLACVSACIEAAAEPAKHEAELDNGSNLETIQVAQAHVAGAVTALQARVEHLEKKDALNALG